MSDNQQEQMLPKAGESRSNESLGSERSHSTTSSTSTGSRSAITPIQVWSPIKLGLTEGEHLHDRDGPNQSKKTVSNFVSFLTNLDVFNVFFEYTTIIQRDPKKSTKTFRKHREANRYDDIPCFEATRVKVLHPTAGHNYYHANYVDGYRSSKYILAQTPMHDNVDQWWRMIWEQKCVLVVSMVPLDGKECPLYIPATSDEKMQFGGLTIENNGTNTLRQSYDATNLFVSNEQGQMRHIVHVTCYNWKLKKGTPSYPTEVLGLLVDLRNAYEKLCDEAEGCGWLDGEDKSPWLVCCSSGVNRAATLVALDILCRRLENTMDEPSGPLIDIENTVLKMRTQRAMAIQRPEQYLVLHLLVYEFIIRKHLIPLDEVNEDSIAGFKKR